MIAPWKRKDTLSAREHPASSADAHLTAFNHQILQYQEEAYTLAYYLLGSADAAAQAVQTAVLQSYQQTALNGSQRLTLLKTVLRHCLRQSTPHAADPLTRGILSLPQDQRRTVLLVDVLGLSYVEAAQVLGTSTGRVSQWLTGGRLAMRAVPAA